MKTQTKRNLICSIALPALMFLLSLLMYHLTATRVSDEILALTATLYCVIFPCISGVLLKVLANDKKSAMIITSVCIVLWSVGDSLFRGERFAYHLLIKAMIFPIIMLFYFITFLIVKRGKKTSSIVIAVVYTLVIAFVFRCAVLFFLSLLGWNVPVDS